MADTMLEAKRLHPLHAVLLASALPLFLGALLTDVAYAQSYEIQWKNLASWLIAGGLVFSGLALLWALIALQRDVPRRGLPLVYCLFLLAGWILGFVNALIHSKDTWASMPEAVILSVIVVAIAGASTWLGLSTLRTGATR